MEAAEQAESWIWADSSGPELGSWEWVAVHRKVLAAHDTAWREALRCHCIGHNRKGHDAGLGRDFAVPARKVAVGAKDGETGREDAAESKQSRRPTEIEVAKRTESGYQ